jgi:hypothetical protein
MMLSFFFILPVLASLITSTAVSGGEVGEISEEATIYSTTMSPGQELMNEIDNKIYSGDAAMHKYFVERSWSGRYQQRLITPNLTLLANFINIDLSGNLITSLKESNVLPPTLLILSYYNNTIEFIAKDFFVSFRNLYKLNLALNRLRSVDLTFSFVARNVPFQKLGGQLHLDLKHNSLSEGVKISFNETDMYVDVHVENTSLASLATKKRPVLVLHKNAPKMVPNSSLSTTILNRQFYFNFFISLILSLLLNLFFFSSF